MVDTDRPESFSEQFQPCRRSAKCTRSRTARSPGRAPERNSAFPRGTAPSSTMSATTIADSARSPPASGVRCWSASARNPSKKRSTQAWRRPRATVSSRGKPKERKAASGRAPMEAMSLSPRARVRWPTDSGGCHSRRKCLPAIDKSVVTASSSPRFSRKIAQSSPIPRRSPPLAERVARRRIRSSRASSPWPPLLGSTRFACRASY